MLIVGLGNPGPSYSFNRHNVGFIFVDMLASFYGFPDFKQAFQGFVSNKIINNNNFFLFKPQTYMNLSGGAVQSIVSFYKINLDDTLVIHDDLDLDFAHMKIKLGGGSAGHNGLKSIDQTISNNYWRLRFGIGRPADKCLISSYVLSNFSSAEVNQLSSTFDFLVENVLSFGDASINVWQQKLAHVKN